jgi:hypothetical protein
LTGGAGGGDGFLYGATDYSSKKKQRKKKVNTTPLQFNRNKDNEKKSKKQQ